MTGETPMTELEALDELPLVCARARLLVLALLGRHGSGLCGEIYENAIRQQACDIADSLDQINEVLVGTA